MYRIVSFFVIAGFVSVMLYAHNEYGHHDHAAMEASAHTHGYVQVSERAPVPTIRGSVKQDPSGAWLLKIETEHFTFTPEKAGSGSDVVNEGHAHLYLNGKKINRLYGTYYNLDYLEKGKHEIKVTLHANDHSLLTYQGEEIAYQEVIEVR